MTQFSVSWDAYKHNIFSGLSALQQNGEFVDMTLAADGHHVKVHQLVMSLVSPYIKELITSAHCAHPIIFLNRISYATLCAILEYIYTGEVLVDKDNLPHVLEAAKELHIKGLKDMKLELSAPDTVSQTAIALSNKGQPLSRTGFFKSTASHTQDEGTLNSPETAKKTYYVELTNSLAAERTTDNETHDEDDGACMDAMDYDDADTTPDKTSIEEGKLPEARIQYTLSNQGALQMILNRCIYYLRYTSRKGPSAGHRQWRCKEYTRAHCRATVITKDDVVVKRYSAHNHMFHDKQIMKRVRDKTVYTTIHDAEALGESRKQGRHAKPSPNKKLKENEKENK